jgi:hypothetical protein
MVRLGIALLRKGRARFDWHGQKHGADKRRERGKGTALAAKDKRNHVDIPG